MVHGLITTYTFIYFCKKFLSSTLFLLNKDKKKSTYTPLLRPIRLLISEKPPTYTARYCQVPTFIRNCRVVCRTRCHHFQYTYVKVHPNRLRKELQSQQVHSFAVNRFTIIQIFFQILKVHSFTIGTFKLFFAIFFLNF